MKNLGKRRKSIISNVFEAYKLMGPIFKGKALIEAVRKNSWNPMIYDTSIFRALRRLRQKKVIDYDLIDHNKSTYRKK